MSDNRDFDLRNLPAIADLLASGVPESLDLSARLEELERERRHIETIERLANEKDAALLARLQTQLVASNFAEDACLIWVGKRDGGYGRVKVDGKWRQTSNVMWEILVGEIPPGTELDHLCRNPACCNVKHLEPVSHRVNILRGESPSAQHARQTHCYRGHPYTPENTYSPPGKTKRQCRICMKEREERRQQKQRSPTIAERIQALQQQVDEAREVARQLTRWAPKNIRAEMQSYPWLERGAR